MNEEERQVTCSCEHNVEDHLPDDFDPAKPCAVKGCACNRFQRLTAFGWLVRQTGPLPKEPS